MKNSGPAAISTVPESVGTERLIGSHFSVISDVTTEAAGVVKERAGPPKSDTGSLSFNPKRLLRAGTFRYLLRRGGS
jgi:hypothetical protein